MACGVRPAGRHAPGNLDLETLALRYGLPGFYNRWATLRSPRGDTLHPPMKGTSSYQNFLPHHLPRSLAAITCICLPHASAALFENEVDSTSPGFVEITMRNAGL